MTPSNIIDHIIIIIIIIYDFDFSTFEIISAHSLQFKGSSIVKIALK